MSPRIALHRRVICQGCTTPCQPHLKGQIDHEDAAATCPIGIWHPIAGFSLSTPAPRAPIVLTPYNGAAKWKRIHTLALTDSLTDAILADIAAMLPICCRPHWLTLMAQYPLPVTGQFAWTVERHNDVNARLGRPLMPLSEAHALYGILT